MEIKETIGELLKPLIEDNYLEGDDIEIQRIISELKQCIYFDAEIQKLMELPKIMEYEGKHEIPYVNIVSLHNNRYHDLKKSRNNLSMSHIDQHIHVDNIGWFTFEALQHFATGKNFLYVPKSKQKISNRRIEVRYDTIFEEYDNEYYKEIRLNGDKKKHRVSLDKNKIFDIKEEWKFLDKNSKQVPFYYELYNQGDTWYTTLDYANLVSFLLFYNSPFHLSYRIKDDLQKIINKPQNEEYIKTMLNNIMMFADDSILKEMVPNNKEYEKAVYIDKIILLSRIDRLFQWICFSSCFSNFNSVYVEPSSKTTKSELERNYYANKYFSSPGVRYSENDTLFFTKWYILSLVNYIKQYDTSSFRRLMQSVFVEYENTRKSLAKVEKENLLDNLFKSKPILKKMLSNNIGSKDAFNNELLTQMMIEFCKAKENPLVRVINLQEFQNFK